MPCRNDAMCTNLTNSSVSKCVNGQCLCANQNGWGMCSKESLKPSTTERIGIVDFFYKYIFIKSKTISFHSRINYTIFENENVRAKLMSFSVYTTKY